MIFTFKNAIYLITYLEWTCMTSISYKKITVNKLKCVTCNCLMMISETIRNTTSVLKKIKVGKLIHEINHAFVFTKNCMYH